MAHSPWRDLRPYGAPPLPAAALLAPGTGPRAVQLAVLEHRRGLHHPAPHHVPVLVVRELELVARGPAPAARTALQVRWGHLEAGGQVVERAVADGFAV